VSYRVRFSDEAKRALADLPGRYRQRARRTIEGLASQPRPAAAKELRGRPGVYRLYLNGWRIIYQIDKDAGIVWIVAVRMKTGPETYEGLDVRPS
jgi:mRNA-degrading endonuclease RelE of RelBE toxin-antitoxin system